jgi:hypothetical protein
MNLDDWKQQTPDEGDYENECHHCGVPCNGTYCSIECKRYDNE